MTESVDHRPGCQLITIEAYGLCTCDFDARMFAITHPEAQGNKDLGEPAASGLEVPEIIRVIAAQIAPDLAEVYGDDSGCTWDADDNIAVRAILWDNKVGILRVMEAVALLQGASAPGPTPPQPIKGESELESASNGMGLR